MKDEEKHGIIAFKKFLTKPKSPTGEVRMENLP